MFWVIYYWVCAEMLDFPVAVPMMQPFIPIAQPR